MPSNSFQWMSVHPPAILPAVVSEDGYNRAFMFLKERKNFSIKNVNGSNRNF